MILRVLLINIWNLLLGHFTVFKHSFKKRVTLEYPEKKPVISERFRGMPVWFSQKCIACKICEKVCPANAVKIDKVDDKTSCKIDLNRCIFCGNCMYHCPKNAICLTDKYELATDDKSTLNLEINSLNSVDEGNIIN